MISVVALTLCREPLNRNRSLLARIAEQLLQKGELLLDLSVLALQLERLLRQGCLRATRDVQIALQLRDANAKLGVFLLGLRQIAFKARLPLFHCAAIKSPEELPEIESP